MKAIESVGSWGHNARRTYVDWLEVLDGFLTMLPVHARAVAATGQPAEDLPEVAEVWKRMADRYGSGWPKVAPIFRQAIGYTLEASTEGDGTPTYHDLIGECFEELEAGNRMDQFFTPWPICQMMAELQGAATIRDQVAERLRASWSGGPELELVLTAPRAGSILALAPKLIDRYEPISVMDPACGSGRMLLAFASLCEPWMVQSGLVQFYGQEVDRTVWLMARSNARLYGLNNGPWKAPALKEEELPDPLKEDVPAPVREKRPKRLEEPLPEPVKEATGRRKKETRQLALL